MARMQGPPQELDIHNGIVYSKGLLRRGRKYGPYAVKWTADPIDKQFAWEVSKLLHLLCIFFSLPILPLNNISAFMNIHHYVILCLRRK